MGEDRGSGPAPPRTPRSPHPYRRPGRPPGSRPAPGARPAARSSRARPGSAGTGRGEVGSGGADDLRGPSPAGAAGAPARRIASPKRGAGPSVAGAPARGIRWGDRGANPPIPRTPARGIPSARRATSSSCRPKRSASSPSTRAPETTRPLPVSTNRPVIRRRAPTRWYAPASRRPGGSSPAERPRSAARVSAMPSPIQASAGSPDRLVKAATATPAPGGPGAGWPGAGGAAPARTRIRPAPTQRIVATTDTISHHNAVRPVAVPHPCRPATRAEHTSRRTNPARLPRFDASRLIQGRITPDIKKARQAAAGSPAPRDGRPSDGAGEGGHQSRSRRFRAGRLRPRMRSSSLIWLAGGVGALVSGIALALSLAPEAGAALALLGRAPLARAPWRGGGSRPTRRPLPSSTADSTSCGRSTRGSARPAYRRSS